MLVCLATVFGSREIPVGILGAPKRPGMSIFCCFCLFLGCFWSSNRSHMYLMHSNVCLRYLLGAHMYYNCFWLPWDPCEDSRGSKRAQNEHICYFCHLLGYFRTKLGSPCISCIQIFSWGTNQVLACVTSTFVFYEIHICSVGASKGPQIEHFCHFCVIFRML